MISPIILLVFDFEAMRYCDKIDQLEAQSLLGLLILMTAMIFILRGDRGLFQSTLGFCDYI